MLIFLDFGKQTRLSILNREKFSFGAKQVLKTINHKKRDKWVFGTLGRNTISTLITAGKKKHLELVAAVRLILSRKMTRFPLYFIATLGATLLVTVKIIKTYSASLQAA